MYSPIDKKPLLVVGSINADLVLEVARLPKPGETISASNLTVFPGGKVRYFAVQHDEPT